MFLLFLADPKLNSDFSSFIAPVLIGCVPVSTCREDAHCGFSRAVQIPLLRGHGQILSDGAGPLDWPGDQLLTCEHTRWNPNFGIITELQFFCLFF